MEDYSIIDKLDFILNVINVNKEIMDTLEIYKFIKFSNTDISQKELMEILFKLAEDKMILFEDNKENTDKDVHSTVNGQILMKRGGYREKYRKESISASLQSAQTWAIAAGTVLAAIGSLGLLFSDKLHWIGTIQFLTLISVSVFAGIGTIILVMIWQSIFRRKL